MAKANTTATHVPADPALKSASDDMRDISATIAGVIATLSLSEIVESERGDVICMLLNVLRSAKEELDECVGRVIDLSKGGAA